MSRSALAVTLALLAVAVAFLFWPGAPETPAPARVVRTAPEQAGAEPSLPPSVTPAPAGDAPPTGLPVLAGTDDLVRLLDSKGLDGRAAVAAWREWRLDQGLLMADPLSGVEEDNDRLRYYASLDRDTLENLGRGGDGVALQVLGDSRLPGEFSQTVELYGLASLAGSAGAMLALAGKLSQPGNPVSTEPLVDATAWRLAALRRFGPAVADRALLDSMRSQARVLPAEALDLACTRSLAILADLSVGQGEPPQPPVFVAPAAALDGLPCEKTAAPVTLPSALRSCPTWPAAGSDGRPVEIWVCNGP